MIVSRKESKLQTSVQYVTPHMASRWLKNNKHNRPPIKSAIKHYARQMRLGRWKLNGDAIRFDKQGNLIDGQNRLLACIEAGCSFWTLVIKGLDSDAFNSIDQGVMRTPCHAFGRDGLKNYAQLAAAVRLIWLLSENRKVQFGGKLSIEDSYKILKDHPFLEEACEYSARWYSDTSPVATSIVSGFMALCFKQGVPLVKLFKFWKPVVTGNEIESGTPQSKLRHKLLGAKLKGSPLGRDTVNALVIKAWNAYAHGEELRVLRFDPTEEKMPKLRP